MAQVAIGPSVQIENGRKCRFRPGSSDIHLLCDGQRVVNLDAEVANRTLDFGVAQEQLHRPQSSGAPVERPELRIEGVAWGTRRSIVPAFGQPKPKHPICDPARRCLFGDHEPR